MAFYRYLQLRHDLQTNFGVTSTKFSDYPLIGVLMSQGPKGYISTGFSHLLATSLNTNHLVICNKWQTLIPDLSDEDREKACNLHLTVSPVINSKLIQLYSTWYISLT